MSLALSPACRSPSELCLCHALDAMEIEEGMKNPLDSQPQPPPPGVNGIYVVVISWFLSIVAIIVAFLHKPIVMIACLLGINVLFPIVYACEWFRRKGDDDATRRDYQELVQSDDSYAIKITMTKA